MDDRDPLTPRAQRAPVDQDAHIAAIIESVRNEFNAGLTTAGVQIGAVEKTLSEKINSVRLWGALALVGGQATAAFITAYVRPGIVPASAHTALRAVALFFIGS